MYLSDVKTNLYPYLKTFYRFFAAGLVMLQFAINVDAQNWALPSSRWEYKTSGCGFAGPCYDYASYDLHVLDTIQMGGRYCSRVVYYNINSSPHYYYTYESVDTAYFYIDNAYRATFYFAAQAGDTLQFYDLFGHSYTHGVVDSVTPTIIASDTFHKFSIRSIDRNWYFKYMDRVGILGTYSGDPFYPGLESIVDADWTYVCNYGDSTLTGYLLYPDSACRSTVGIHDLSAGAHVRFYPNPSSGTLTIDVSGYEPGERQISVYDEIGQMVYSQLSDRSVETISLHIARGVYTVEIEDERHSDRGRIVVE